MVNLPSDRRRALLLASPVVAAVLLAAALVGIALVAAGSLRARDEAVRDGLLARVGHELESLLRERGPDDASGALEEFGTANATIVRGAEAAGSERVLARWGDVSGVPFEMPGMLGPAWRPGGGGAWPRVGPGRGSMRSPFVLRLYPVAGAGRESLLAGALVFGSAAAGAGLVVLALFAARGLAERERIGLLEAERRRLDTLALAGAGLAHRVRNPLAAIKGTAQLMAERPDEQVAERSRRIVEASGRIEDLVSQLLKFARPAEPQPEAFDLVVLAREAVARAGGAVAVSGDAAADAFADPGHADDVLDELLANARAHDQGGALEVVVGTQGGAAWAEVRDRGPGLSVDAERAFDPYVTSRPGGTGLGLPTVRALARANGGDVTLGPRPGGGAVARLSLPRGAR